MSPILINICSNPSEMALKNCSLKKEKPPKKRVSNFLISQILSKNRDETHGTNSEHENSASSPREVLRNADSPTCLKNEASASGSQSREDEITDCTRRWQDVNRITPEERLVADGDMDDDCTTPNEEQPWDILNSFLKLSQNQKSSPVFENHAGKLVDLIAPIITNCNLFEDKLMELAEHRCLIFLKISAIRQLTRKNSATKIISCSSTNFFNLANFLVIFWLLKFWNPSCGFRKIQIWYLNGMVEFDKKRCFWGKDFDQNVAFFGGATSLINLVGQK